MSVHATNFTGIKFAKMWEALQWADASGLEPITIAGGNFCVTMSERNRIESMGIEFGIITEHDDKIMVVPVN